MADRTRWNAWAPQFIADLVHDFGFTPEQAAGFVGNFAAESAYFNDIVEDGAIARGWAGGTGFAQWTGPRRRTFETWLKRKGFKADSYEGNYSYLFRELKGYESGADHRYVVPIIKAATSPENAAWRVAKYFERPKVINTGPRAKAAREALELYLKNPPPPTAWATDRKEDVEPKEAAVPETKVIVTNADPAKPVVKSIVMQGAIGGLVTALYAIVQEYNPAVSFKEQPATFWYAIAGFLTAAWTIYGRVSSNAQPLTLTQDGADKIAQEKVLSKGPDVPAAAPAPVPVHQPEPPPMEQLSIQQFAMELPRVVDLLKGFVPALAAISTVTQVLGEVSKIAPHDRRPS